MRARARNALGFGVVVALVLLVLPDAVGRLVAGPPASAELVFFAQDAMRVVDEGADVIVHDPGSPLPHRLPKARRDHRPRVLFVGESSVRRGPENATYDFPTQVARLLPEVDCVNLGAPAAKIRSIVDLLSQLDAVEYDLVVVYTGHNEYADVLFAGELPALPRWRLRALALARQSYLYDLAVPAAAPTAPRREPFSTAETLVPTSDAFPREAGANIEANYAAFLEDLIRASRAPVILGTLLRSFDLPPTGLLLSADHPTCRGEATRAVKAPRQASADALRAACGADHAVTLWVEAQQAHERGDVPAALDFWGRMLRADPLPLRAPLSIDDATRTAAARHGTRLVDVAAQLGPIVPQGLLADVLHPNELGAQRIAATLAPAIKEELVRAGRWETASTKRTLR